MRDQLMMSMLPAALGAAAAVALCAPAASQGYRFDNLTPFPANPDGTAGVAFGDLDGDGDVDAVLGSYMSPTKGQDRVLLNDGSGVFVDVTATHFPVYAPTGGWDLGAHVPALADVDGDNDLDLMMAQGSFDSTAAGHNRLFLNDGNGVFSDVTATHMPLPFSSTNSRAIAMGDLDGDGDVDVLLGNSLSNSFTYWYPEQNQILINDGSGHFADETQARLPSRSDNTVSVALGDVDGDGDLDALIGNNDWETEKIPPHPDESLLLINDGKGNFSDVTTAQMPQVWQTTTSVVLGDLDGDLDLDAVHANTGDFTVFLNDGMGTFAATATYPAQIGELSLGDVDGDGDLDLFVRDGVGSSKLFANDGSAGLTDVTAAALAPGAMGSVIAMTDLDGDGDVDAFAREDIVLTNLSQQLYIANPPSISAPLTLKISGGPGGAGHLFIAAAPAAITIPPLGTLRLDPATIVWVTGGPLDASGQLSVTLPATKDPVFLGVSLYWQAGVTQPLALTNLAIATFGN